MSCDRNHEELVAYLDGELDRENRRQLERHLAGCRRCSRILDELRQAVEASRQLEVVEPSADFRREFWWRFATESRQAPGWWAGPPRWRWPVLAAGGALAAGLAVAVVMLVSRPRVSEADKVIASHLELFSDYDVIRNLDILEDMEFIESLDEDA
ncbi:MAG: hypothetical protein DRI34_10905 [Deltaproteobacteria bacterium]|nr:MAG: hypothetical protein DRI34_10905 [Deltaproteobacteria bacterium]